MNKSDILDIVDNLRETISVYCTDRSCEGEEEIDEVLDELEEVINAYL
jgi:hypothetical protein